MASDTEQIKQKLDIVDFIGEYVQLKAAGINHKGLCPFHQEKSPSFMVNRDRQRYHCFGCNKGGDIFSFVQEMEGMEFIDALKFLAQRAGVELIVSKEAGAKSSQKSRIKEINTEAARFFYKVLNQLDAAKPAREYLQKRGLREETIDAWQIGYVPDQWDLLTRYLLKKGYSIDDLVAAGLTIRRDGANAKTGRGFYDRFRARVMFPIRNEHGAVVGFTGRVLVETEKSGGKYVNTPQTPVYDKSRVMFGLYHAKKEARQKDVLVLAEGQLDVISSHQAGITNVVATSGTALTPDQITLVKRYTKNIRMAFDTDDAGVAAAKRGIDLALEAGLSVKVIEIPGGKDPDECIRSNPEDWKQAIDHARDVMSWYQDRVFAKYDSNDLQQKQKIADILLAEIARIPYAVERDHWMTKLARRLGVEVSVLREDLARIKASGRSAQPVRKDASEQKTKPIAQKRGRLELLTERLLALLLRFPRLCSDILPQIREEYLSTTPYLPLYQTIKKEYNVHTRELDIEKLSNVFSSGQSAENPIEILLMRGELDFLATTEAGAKNEAERLVHEIRSCYLKDERRKLQTYIEQAEQSGNHEQLEELLKQFSALQ